MKRTPFVFIGMSITSVLLAPRLADAQVANLKPTKEAWVFEDVVDNTFKKPIRIQVLTIEAKNVADFLRINATSPRLSLVCRDRGSRIEMMISNAGIFQISSYSGGVEWSAVEYRFEFSDTTATSFIPEAWRKMEIKDAIYTQYPNDFIRLMFLSRTVLVKLSLDTFSPTAQFDLTGLIDQIPKMTLCSNELNKLDGHH